MSIPAAARTLALRTRPKRILPRYLIFGSRVIKSIEATVVGSDDVPFVTSRHRLTSTGGAIYLTFWPFSYSTSALLIFLSSLYSPSPSSLSDDLFIQRPLTALRRGLLVGIR